MKETVPAYRRHDLSDETGALLEPHLPGRKRSWGGVAHDNRQFIIEGLSADHLIADKGYDTDAILDQAAAQDMNAVIPPKKNRTVQRPYDENLYKLRHLVENAFLHLKRWRGIATRYAKNSASFLAAVHIRCLALWLKIS